jgi:hypothetical protein
MGICLYCQGHENYQVYKIFKSKMKTKIGLIPNPNCEIKKTKTRHVQDKNPIRFNCKIEIKQGCDKKTYLKLVLNN